MKRYSNNKDINQEVQMLIKSGWKVKMVEKHAKVISPSGPMSDHPINA